MVLHLIAFLFGCIFAPAVSIPCPMPQEVPASEFPPNWERSGDLIVKNDGNKIRCASNEYIGKMSADANVYTFPSQLMSDFFCDTKTGTWRNDWYNRNYEAPLFLTCGTFQVGAPETHCDAWHSQRQTDDPENFVFNMQIRLYPGNEQFCPPGQKVKYFTRGLNSMCIDTLTCTGDRELVAELEDGTLGSGSDLLECGICISCPIKNKKSDGTLEKVILRPGKEQFCPKGTIPRFAYGAAIDEMKCEQAGLQITVPDGKVIEYEESNPPTLECVVACPIKNVLPNGDFENITVLPGKEQFCPKGEIAVLEDGSYITELKCTSSSLVIKAQNGSVLMYPDCPPTLNCAPGVCTESCAGPTTTTSTTTTTTTTTKAPTTTTTKAPTITTSTTTTTTTTKPPPSPNCPAAGAWGEWVVTGTCPTTCGSCNVAPRKRACASYCGDCPCTGPSEDVGPCGIALCPFPTKTCCQAEKPYIKSLNHQNSEFFCGLESVPAATFANGTECVPK